MRWIATPIVAVMLAACGSQPASKEGGAAASGAGKLALARLRIGYQAIPNAELVAKQLKWHEQTLGIPIEWRQFESGRDVNTAIAAGSIDIGLSGSGGAATALAQGLPLSVIAIHDVIGSSEALAVRSSASIRGVADLRGKRLAAPFASTTHYSLLKLLELNGIGASEVTLLDLNPSDMTAAWIRGDIDAAYVWQPTLQRLLDAGGTRLTSSDEMAARGVATFDVGVASDGLMSAHPEAIVSYLKTLSRAVGLYRTDRQQALDALARELGVSVDQAKLQAEGLLWLTAEEQLDGKYFGTAGTSGAAGATGGLAAALKATADFLVAQKVIRAAPDIAIFQQRTDGQFLRRAAATGRPGSAAAGGAER
jgi:taurine transport system substrate-binding protein